MYCIDCGTQNLDTTRYCSRCGSNLEVLRHALTQPLTAPETASLISQRHVWLILTLSGLVSVVGISVVFGVLFGLADTLVDRIGGGVIPLLFVVGGIGIAGVVLIVRSLLKLLNTSGPARTPTGPLVAQLAAPRQNVALPAPPYPQPVGSVVEHTTARLGNYAPPNEERER